MSAPTIFTPTLAEAFNRTPLRYFGCEPKPGRLARFSTDEHDSSDSAGWIRVFPDGDGAVFGCWRQGETWVWQRRDDGAPPLSEAESRALRTKVEQARREGEEDRERQYEKAAERAAHILEGQPALSGDHAYVQRKRITPYGAYLDHDGRLMLPVRDGDGRLQSLQFIAPDGEKRFLPGGKIHGGRLYLGVPVDGAPLVLAEGWATGCSLHEATAITVVVGYSGSNLRHVAVDLRQRFPKSKIVIAGDVDPHGAGAKYARDAKVACEPSGSVFPQFSDGRVSGDFNDLAQTQGLSAVQAQLLVALAVSPNSSENNAVIPFSASQLDVTDVRNGTPSTRPLTEHGNAQRLLDLYRDHARYIPETKCWLVWSSAAWIRDPDGAAIRSHAAALSGSIYKEGLGFRGEQAVHFARWGRTSESVRVIRAAVDLLSDEKKIRLSLGRVDANPMLIGLNQARSVIDLRSGTVRASSPKDFITKSMNCECVGEAAKAVRWLAFLDQVFGGDMELIDWLHRWCGYLLSGSTAEQFLVFCYGVGANGKSVFAELLRWIMADYARAVPIETLCESKRQAGGASPDLAALIGCRLAASSETEDGVALAESLVKSLVSGDTISARPLYGQPIEFQPAFKLMMMGNHRPIIRGSDYGIWRRIRLVPFCRTFALDERDPQLLDKLKAEASHILAWMVQGCIEWQQRGLTDVPRVVAKQTADYQEEQDVFGRFLSECTDCGATEEVTGRELYLAYRQWATDEGLKVASNISFGRRIKERGFDSRRSNGKTIWIGLGIKAANDPIHAREYAYASKGY